MNRKASFTLCALAAFGTAWGQGSAPGHLVMKAKIRDFREYNTVDTVNMHPHFNTKEGTCSAQGFGKPSAAPDISLSDAADGNLYEGDNRGPRLIDTLSTELRACFEPLDRFSDWFQDREPDVNRAFQIELRFLLDTATGMYQFKSNAFFPIDSGRSFSKYRPNDPAPFGHLQKGVIEGVDVTKHNYGFTMEVHSTFQYHKGRDQIFQFAGDDDLWVYMNGKLTLDLGGVHQSQEGIVHLDELGLDSGEVYPLDLFFAERRTSGSNCVITTSLVIGNTVPAVATPEASPLGDNLPVPREIGLSSLTADAVIYYTKDGSTPDSTKSRYNNDSINVRAGTTLKAIAYKPGWIASEVMSVTFKEPTTALRVSPLVSRRLGRPGEILLFNVPEGTRVSLHDRQGRTVRVLSVGTVSASGAHSLLWNGEDASGRPMAPGLYFWKAVSKDVSSGMSGMVLSPQ